MKHPLAIAVFAALLLTAAACTSYAAEPQPQCRAAKTGAAGTYAGCLHNAEKALIISGSATKREAAIVKCEEKFLGAWQKADDKASEAGVLCLEAPLTVSSFKAAIDDHAENMASGLSGGGLLHGCTLSPVGPGATPSPDQIKCHAAKNKAAGKYVACRHSAGKALIISGSATKYAESITKCEGKFVAAWQKAIDKATDAGATCLDAPLTAGDFKTVIDEYATDVETALGGGGLTGGCVPDDPVAVDDAADVYEGSPAALNLLGNDTDIDNVDNGNAGLTIVGVTSPPAGQGTTNLALGVVTYTPDPGYFGSTTFDYTIEDPTGGTDTATVIVTMTYCGDSIVQSAHEGCDQGGNSDETDGCTTECVVGRPCHAADFPGLPLSVSPPAKFAVEPSTGHCYVGSQMASPLSWFAMGGLCQDSGGYLAMPRNLAEESNYIFPTRAGSGAAWLGIHDLIAEGTFVAITGEPFNTHWTGGEPNNFGDADCVQMFNSADHTWDDLACSAALPQLVCEFAAEVCGDGAIQGNSPYLEQCDDRNDVSGDGCSGCQPD